MTPSGHGCLGMGKSEPTSIFDRPESSSLIAGCSVWKLHESRASRRVATRRNDCASSLFADYQDLQWISGTILEGSLLASDLATNYGTQTLSPMYNRPFRSQTIIFPPIRRRRLDAVLTIMPIIYNLFKLFMASWKLLFTTNLSMRIRWRKKSGKLHRYRRNCIFCIN